MKKGTKNVILISVITILVLAGGYLVYSRTRKSEKENQNKTAVENQNANQNSSEKDKGTNANVLDEHCLKNPESGTGLITIEKPEAYAEVKNPFVISGKANVFEGEFLIRLKDCDGRVIEHREMRVQGSGINKLLPYGTSFEVELLGKDYRDIYIEAFEISAKDGSEENLIQMPVRVVE